MIWAIFALLALVATGIALIPVLSGRLGAARRSDIMPAVFEDQLREIARDRDRGLISPAEAQAAELEIKRRIVALARREGDAKPAPATTIAGKPVMIVAALLVPAIAFGYYALRGTPQVASLAYADRAQERAEQARIGGLANQLLERLQSDPEGGPTEGWMLLGQTYSRMGRHEDAVRAFEVIADRPDATSDTFSRYGEALINAETGIVTPQAMAALDKSLALDADNPAATYYKSLGLSQAGAEEEAYALLVSRLERAPSYEPWMDIFVAQINRVGQTLGREPQAVSDLVPTAPRGPSAADVANASEMTQEDRAAFIQSMVERLAARLEEQPDDLDGWLRLANAYVVLGRQDDALEAYRTAEPLVADLPAEDPRRDVVSRALSELGG